MSKNIIIKNLKLNLSIRNIMPKDKIKIEKVIKVSKDEFLEFMYNLTEPNKIISNNHKHMFKDDKTDIFHCIVITSDSDDVDYGVIVFARYQMGYGLTDIISKAELKLIT